LPRLATASERTNPDPERDIFFTQPARQGQTSAYRPGAPSLQPQDHAELRSRSPCGPE